MKDLTCSDLLPYFCNPTAPVFNILLQQQFDHNAVFHFAKNLGLMYNIHLSEISSETCMALQPDIRDDFKTILTKIDVIYYLLNVYRMEGREWFSFRTTMDVTQFWLQVRNEKHLLSKKIPSASIH